MKDEEEKKETEKALKEINQAMRDSINQWADIMLEAEAKQWAYHLKYFPRDVFNATYIFQHVLSNVGIKAGKIDEEKAKEYGNRLHQLVKDMTGIDLRELPKIETL